MLCVVVALYLITTTIFSLPQTRYLIAGRVSTELTNLLGATTIVKDFDFRPFNCATLRDMVIYDQKKLPLLKAEQLNIKISLINLLRNNLLINYIELNNPLVNIYKETETSDTNVKFILDKFNKDSDNNESTKINALLVVINNMSIKYDVKDAPHQRRHHFDENHIELSALNSNFKINILDNDSLYIKLRSLNFNERCGFKVNQIRFEGSLNKTSGNLYAFQLNTPYSTFKIDGKSKVSFPSNNDSKVLLYNVGVSKTLIKSTLNTKDIAYFIQNVSSQNQNSYKVNAIVEKNGPDVSIRTNMLNNDRQNYLSLNADTRIFISPRKKEPLAMYTNINDLNLSSNQLNMISDMLALDDGISTFIENIGDLKYKGYAQVRDNLMLLKGKAETSIGNFDEELEYTGDRVNAKATLHDFDLRKMLGRQDNLLGCVSGDVLVEGKTKPLLLNVQSKIAKAQVNGYDYKNITAMAKYQPDMITANGKIDDPNAHCSFNGTYKPVTESISANIKLAGVKPSKLHLPFGPDAAVFSADIVANMSDIQKNMSGMLLLKDVVMQTDSVVQSFDSLRFVSTKHDKMYRAEIRSDMLDLKYDGNVELLDMPQLFAGVIEDKIPEIKKLVKTKKQTNATAYFDIHTKNLTFLESLLNIPIHVDEVSYIGGRMTTSDSGLSLVADLPSFTLNNSTYKGATVYMNGQRDSLALLTQVTKSFNEDDVKFVLDATAQKGTLLSQLEWKDLQNDGIQGYIKFLTESGQDLGGIPITKIRFYPSTFLINDSLWDVSTSVIEIGKDRFQMKDFRIGRNDRYIQANGLSTPDLTDNPFRIDIKDIDLEYVFDLLDFHPVYFGGKATGTVEMQDVTNLSYADIKLQVNDFTFNTGKMGTLQFTGKWDNAEQRLNIDAITQRESTDTTLIQGYVDIDADSINLHFHSVNTTAAFLNQYLSGVFDDIQGNINGNLHLFGPLSAIQLEGDEEIVNVRLSPKVLNTDYIISRDSVHFRPNRIIFDNVTIKDYLGHTSTVNGEVSHRVLHDFAFNFNFSLNNLLAYNWNERETDTFWGTVYADGLCHLWGNPDEVHVDANLTPQKGSVFTYDSSNPENADKKEYIHFTKPRVYASPVQDETVHVKDSASDAYLNLNINSNPDVALVIITDNKTGDNMRLNGHGPLHATYYNKGRFDLYGNYTIDHGEYKITIQDIIHKRFQMQPGGTLRFNGEPFDGDLNMKGVYSVNSVSLSDLNLGNLSNSTVQVDCILNFTGKAGEPQVSFDLDFPNVNNEERQMVRNMIASQGDMNMQVMYLLGFGRFFTYDYATFDAAGGQGQSTLAMTSLLANTLSGQLNNMLQNAFHVNNWSFGTNVATGRLGWQDVEVEGLLSGSLLNNRLLINGNFGYRDQTTYANNFVGDFNVRWLLNRSGTISLKAYSETNDRYFTKSSLTTNGAGILFQRDFTNLKEFFRSNDYTRRVNAGRKDSGKRKSDSEKSKSDMEQNKSDIEQSKPNIIFKRSNTDEN